MNTNPDTSPKATTPRRPGLKLYLGMCLLSLLTGLAIGHVNGTFSAAANFVDDCASISMVVLRDTETDTARRFHCFEINVTGGAKPKPVEKKESVPMI